MCNRLLTADSQVRAFVPREFRHQILQDLEIFVQVDVVALTITKVPNNHYCSVNAKLVD